MTKREEAAQALLDWFETHYGGEIGSVVDGFTLTYLDTRPVDMLDLVDVVVSSLANSQVT